MITLATADDAHTWGTQLAPTLAPGDVIALCGNLGAGKTQITRGIVEGMQSKAEVTSPTFTLVHEYLDGRLPVFHFDFYRMESAAEVIGIGWDEFLSEPGVIIVEWADMFPDLMPPNTRWFHIEALPDGSRRVTEGPLAK
ncbi:MAG: tRNA (adenosine(37)-N6)-threonylcarbamoyltransferase complex ATPase subunit type 1 TsaE [Prosthecobacter sp.]|jgi:tRNA threonylcarbamoyladenosine biosynthesis protein TsaE|uniref:tRNA (adenosine(37)-N6)-threonylcarbamoyltransferase complex ATPase subunit type 1 TsaE n=1 Tax=Prosthecobacter sp. TaxID=1965333 RepID=UPI0019FFAC39|nr:tRNA (adenosine(37)-N6)-threonylcarbamoyltransferase complex ATPase subunit type 1 TsaE [Prosthecobacter sp.]MBE2287652.1 tRNA (adenosine(37)-N6)-threonylcarbamoyltransferase complex ATPase subunit type 1 TsaE [Prosthecobacter sp.]